jgi:hypothetical protein
MEQVEVFGCVFTSQRKNRICASGMMVNQLGNVVDYARNDDPA